MAAPDIALLQLCDSLFPVGSFAHSDGLESAVAAGHVSSAADLQVWLDGTLDLTLTKTECPAVRDAFIAARCGDMNALAAVDEEIDAMRPSAAGREATRAMGTRLLKTWQQIRPSSVVDAALASRSRCTFPVAFATVCAASGVELRDSIEAYAYTRLASTISAAMRLMPIGQHEAHRLLALLLRRVPACAEAVVGSDASPHSFMPMMDIGIMNHRYVHSRLFRS
jgi:urease accessory protein